MSDALIQAFALIVVALAVPEREAALALYRRWQGSHGGHRWIKVSILCLHEAAWAVWAMSPILSPILWTWPLVPPQIIALSFPAIYASAVAVWFTYKHNNGGAEGRGGPARYGWSGYGYLWAYPFRSLIPSVALGRWQLIDGEGWTCVGELFLGAMTGRLTAVFLIATYVLMATIE